ncbi:MAG: hypothetical protein L0Y67_09050 [Gammaproteobacteria bacterium]|nr:hypothetical protein [Gammaproteobacteria bacterium]
MRSCALLSSGRRALDAYLRRWFDSRLTTHANLDRLNKLGIEFITLRRRSAQMRRAIHRVPDLAWRRIELKNIARAYRAPKIVDEALT